MNGPNRSWIKSVKAWWLGDRVLPILLACLLTLLAGYALKTVCPTQAAGTYPRLCYTDVTALYLSRGLDRGVVPYLDFPAGGSYLDQGLMAYPVGSGVVMFATAAIANGPAEYLLVNAILLGAIALACAALLVRLVGVSAIRWAAAPILALYAFHNWDLLAVGCVVAGCFMQARERPGWAGLWFGAGIAVKLYPVLFLAPLALERLWARDNRGAARAAAAGIAAFVLPNLIVALANLDGWWATYWYHSNRGADLGTVWAWILPDGTSAQLLNFLMGLALLMGGVAVLAVGWRRAARERAYPFLPVASALVVVFLLVSKVASPQYALWLLPSLVLLRLRLRWWVSWNLVGILVYLVSFGVGLAGYEFGMAREAILVAGVIRALVLVALAIVFLRAPTVAPPSIPQGQGATWRRLAINGA